MELNNSKRLGLRASVLICLLIILISSIAFIAFISSTLVFRLGNISVSVAEKDITAEYVSYVRTLMDRKAKEYSHTFELGLKLAGIYASQAGFLYDHIGNFKFDNPTLEEFRNEFYRDEQKGLYLNVVNEFMDILASEKGMIDLDENLSLYYGLSLLNPFLATTLAESTYFDYFNLILFEQHYQVFFTNDKLFSISNIKTADSVRKYVDRFYNEFSSKPEVMREVDYRYKSLDTLDALTCTVKYFSKMTGKLLLSATIGINKNNFTRDLEKEEIYIIENWKGLKEEEFAKNFVFTFVYDSQSSEFVILPLKGRELFGFIPGVKILPVKTSDTSSFSDDRFYAYNSSNTHIRALASQIAKEKNGQFHIVINNMEYLFIYQKLDYADWILFTAIPYSILLDPAAQVRRNMFNIIYDFNSDLLIISIIFFALTALITIFLFRRYILYPVMGFNDRAIKMSQGNFAVSVIAKGGRELYDLGVSFNQLSGELRKYMKNLEFEIEAQANLESEMDIARKIQESMLPSYAVMPNDERYSIFCQLIPAKEVAGDFYDLMKLDENKLMFLVADVSGKGISAAFFMSIAKNVIRNACINEPDNPAVAMRNANEILAKYGTQMFVTVFLCYLDLPSGSIKYANAGHNEALMITSEGKYRYFGKLGNAMAGFIEGLDFKLGEDVINQGETLILYTDGVTEATSPSEELFEEERLAEIASINSQSELRSLVAEIIHAVDNFDNGIQFDDITLLTIRKN